MKYELNAGEKAKTLKVWDKKQPTNIEIVNEMWKYEKPTDYEFYVFRYSDRVELRQDLFLLSDRGAEKIEKLIHGSLTEVKVLNRDAALAISVPTKEKKPQKAKGFER